MIEDNFNDEYQFHLIVKQLREFFYASYCDFYLESTKPILKKNGTDDESIAQQEFVWNILRICTRMTLLMYHPFLPSLTEELWQKYKMGEGESILETKYPKYSEISQFIVGFSSYFFLVLISGIS